jgi:hypothetical protein
MEPPFERLYVMVVDFALRFCRICGGDIDVEEQTCPLCNSRQQPDKRLCSTGLIIVLALLGFFGIMFLGIISAHAIQQILSVRTNTNNTTALNTISSAKIGVDKYFARNGQFPKTLDQIYLKPEDGVTLTLNTSADSSYRLVSFHTKGNKEYLAVSGKVKIYYKERKQTGLRYPLVQ